MSLDDALAADRRGEIRTAAIEYENALRAGAITEECVLNLAILYWQATDFGMVAAYNLDSDFLKIASTRCGELLRLAQAKFPQNAEPRFWERYIAWADLGEHLSAEECRGFLAEDPQHLVPAMHLFAISQGREAVPEARLLLSRCLEDRTARTRYIASVIQGVMRRAGSTDTI